MEFPATIQDPLVSVVIPCYNQAIYLAEAIESIRSQQGVHKEIIVVDDGSVDNTKEVAQRFSEVRYVYQSNQGLPAARNTGIAHSSGDYLVFLDADDWLLPRALQTNLSYLLKNSRLAFVSGGYKLLYAPEQKIWEVTREVTADHYQQLLQGNYIGMHAAVMFPRWVLEDKPYDESLKACEDYDLYLRLARDYPVQHHTGLMAMYRVHTENMSGNYILMLRTALNVLRRQQKKLRSREEKNALEAGHLHFKQYYTSKLFDRLLHNLEHKQKNELKEIVMLFYYNSPLYWKYYFEKRRIRRKEGLLVYQRLAGKLRALLR